MKVTVSTDPSDPEYVARVLHEFEEMAKQEPYLAMKMVEFLQAGILRAIRDQRDQMHQTCQALQGRVLREEPLDMKKIGEAFDKGTPPWRIII